MIQNLFLYLSSSLLTLKWSNRLGVRVVELWRVVAVAIALFILPAFSWASGDGGSAPSLEETIKVFPRSLDSYADAGVTGVFSKLVHRITDEPFNLVATLLFLAAIFHTFMASRLSAIAHRWEEEHDKKKRAGQVPPNSIPMGARLLHFLGEVETVFGIWSVVLLAGIALHFNGDTAISYIVNDVNFTEAMFVVVIMTLASTRPILKLAESIISRIAGILGGSLTAWWMTILILGPLLGSFITEPAAMTITAMLLASKFYILNPSNRFKYATLGLLFVSVSIGGTLTHFAAPPVLMVADPWNWDMIFMFTHFGLEAISAIALSTTAYAVFFRKELKELSHTFQLYELKETVKHRFLDRAHFESKLDLVLQENDVTERFTDGINQHLKEISDRTSTTMRKRFLDAMAGSGIQPAMAEQAFDEVYSDVVKSRLQRKLPGVLPPEKRAPWIDPEWDNRVDPVPVWVIIVHLMFIVWTVVNAHHPQMFIPGLLFFLAFANITEQYQNRVNIRSSLLVGFFLGGLVIHGGLQGWWIEPVLGSLSEIPLMLAATGLTAFNDNSAITYLSTLVPNFSEGAKYAVVAGAVAGGGLTVIANAPNPAGQSILKHHFGHGVSALSLLLGALVPTIVAVSIFLLTR